MKGSQNFEKNLSLCFVVDNVFLPINLHFQPSVSGIIVLFRQRKKYEGKVHSLLQCKSGDDEAENKRN